MSINGKLRIASQRQLEQFQSFIKPLRLQIQKYEELIRYSREEEKTKGYQEEISEIKRQMTEARPPKIVCDRCDALSMEPAGIFKTWRGEQYLYRCKINPDHEKKV